MGIAYAPNDSSSGRPPHRSNHHEIAIPDTEIHPMAPRKMARRRCRAGSRSQRRRHLQRRWRPGCRRSHRRPSPEIFRRHRCQGGAGNSRRKGLRERRRHLGPRHHRCGRVGDLRSHRGFQIRTQLQNLRIRRSLLNHPEFPQEKTDLRLPDRHDPGGRHAF